MDSSEEDIVAQIPGRTVADDLDQHYEKLSADHCAPRLCKRLRCATNKSRFLENRSDDLWPAIPDHYLQAGFVVLHNARHSKRVKTKADFVIESVVGVNDTQLVFLLIRDKRPSEEAHRLLLEASPCSAIFHWAR